MLDRKNPSQPAKFAQKLSSNTDVPPELAKWMTPDHLLFFSCVTRFTPQGGLFAMLQQNGAGAELHKLEQLTYVSGSGMSTKSIYALVTVPGSGMPGIEHVWYASQLIQSASGSGSSGSSVPVLTPTIVLSMIPGSQGYTPTEVGGQ